MICSSAGFLLGLVTAVLTQAPSALRIVYVEYLLCGIAMLLFNRGFHLKTSGHACGIAGPVVLFIYFQWYIPAAIGGLLMIPVFVSSIGTKQHTLWPLLGGCLIAVICLILIKLLFGEAMV